MIRFIMLTLGLAALVAAVAIPQNSAEKPKPAEKSEKESIQKAFQAYLEAFNKHDAKAVAGFWTESCVYMDRDSGAKTEGRNAILADMQKLFKDHTKVHFELQISSIRLIKPDVALVEGQDTINYPGEYPDNNAFSAIVIKQGDSWLIDSVQEQDLPAPATAYDGLKDLEWLLGQWKDVTEGVDVETAVRWSSHGSFLIRSYSVQFEKEEKREGTQVIGWDPANRRIRSWCFDTDGSFDEGYWSKSGNEWLVRSTRTMADGDMATSTQVIKKVSNETFTVQTIASEVNGEPELAGPIVTVQRVELSLPEKK